MDHLVTKVQLIHPHPLEGTAVAEWLSKKPFIQFEGKSLCMDELATSLRTERFDMLIVFAYHVANTANQIVGIKKIYPYVKLLVVSRLSDIGLVQEIIHRGVHGYISMDAEIEEWESAIRAVSEGRIYYGQEVMKQLAEPLIHIHSSEPEPRMNNSLSKRETEVLRLVANEYSTNRIADALFISEKTVETHRRNLFQKLGVKNSVGLTKIAIQMGMV